jgi:TonB family protein
MNWEGRAPSLFVCCIMAFVAGCATAPVTTAPHPARDFPSSESFYPYSAKLWAQEGTASIHYCVDDTGHLSGEPSLKETSGDHDLDGAALALAKAGDGHYLPGYQAGKAVAGCDDFKVRFILRDEAGFPVLSRRSKQLTHQMRPQLLSLMSEVQQVQHPGALSDFVPGDREQLKQLHGFVASASPLLTNADVLFADYIEKMDKLGRSDDVPEAERTAFSKHWQKQRIYLREIREMMFDMRAMVVTVSDLLSYVEGLHPPQGSDSERYELTGQQGAEIRLLIERGRIEYEEAQARIKGVADRHSASAGELQNVPTLVSNPREEFPEKTYITLEAVGSADDLATSTPNLTVPMPVTALKDVPGCSFRDAVGSDFEGGMNLFQLRLSDTGAVSSVELERTSGSAELDALALKCVPGVRFQPATRDGKPVASVIQFPFKWAIGWDSSHQKTCDRVKSPAGAQALQSSSNQPKMPSVIICSCWEESGRVNGPYIVEWSGDPRLDDGALKLAASSGFGKPRAPGHPGCDAYKTQFDVHR